MRLPASSESCVNIEEHPILFINWEVENDLVIFRNKTFNKKRCILDCWAASFLWNTRFIDQVNYYTLYENPDDIRLGFV